MPEGPSLRWAAHVAPLVAPDRLRLARELQGWTQQELVEAAGKQFSAAALSQLERGRTRPSAATLLAIAEATRCPVEFFVPRPGDRQPEGFFRSLQSTSARERRQQLARARLLHDFVSVLEEHVLLPELDVPRFRPADPTDADIEDVAERVRELWDVEPGPIANVVRTLERHGVVVVRAQTFKREVDAFSVCFQKRPIVVVGTEKAVMARSRFDAAHELGHLVLHTDDDAGTRAAELQAHAFAAAFLMPASTIRGELSNRVDWNELRRLKVRWRVSIAALLRRAKTLRVISDHSYVNAMKLMSARGWRTREPGDEQLGALESPVLLQRALTRASELGHSVRSLASEAGLPAPQLERLIEATRDPRPEVQL